MVGVFSVFGALPLLMFKQFGVGLAAAILIDATIVRGVLLLATMNCSASGTGTCRAGWMAAALRRRGAVDRSRGAAGCGFGVIPGADPESRASRL